MKIFLSCITAILYTTALFAQKPDIAIGEATYEFVHIRDTTNRDKPYKEDMVLLLGRNASVYRSLSKQQQEQKMAEDMATQVKTAVDPNHLNLTIKGVGVVSNEEYYQYVNSKKLYTEEQIINYYLTEEPLPAIAWTIHNDTTSFGTLHTQKATAHFKGREYTAWFCADLPFHSGPWKLNGLPGLILQASDSKKEVVFNFTGFKNIAAAGQTIVLPVDDIKTTIKELVRLKEARAKDPIGFSKAAHGGNSNSKRGINSSVADIDPGRIASITVVKSTSTNTHIINNPIELPKKNRPSKQAYFFLK